jgi:TolA-binding protein
MLDRFSGWCRKKAPFLFEEVMPVWLTMLASILAGIAAAYGTYQLAPAINRQYQIDEARTTHVAETTKSLNAEIIELSQKVRRLNEALVNERSNAAEIRGESLDLVTKLQWILVDLKVVLKSDADREAVESLKVAITGVKNALDVSVDARAQPKLLAAMRTLGDETRNVLDRLYVAASLK